MKSQTIYLSFPPEARTHGVAVGKVLDSLEYAHVDGSSQSRSEADVCHVLVRIQTLASRHAHNMADDTHTFVSFYNRRGERRIVDVILEPGYVVWPESLPLPITYVDAVGQSYTDWVHDLEQALATGQVGNDVSDYGNDSDEYYEGDDDYDFDGYFEEDPE
ncbi:MAG TPA: hypothetical protein VJN88_13665 [Ktedonobacterales bacterium]|nr:hypothetical protein [Ktedonobacterales bacterium]